MMLRPYCCSPRLELLERHDRAQERQPRRNDAFLDRRASHAARPSTRAFFSFISVSVPRDLDDRDAADNLASRSCKLLGS